MHLKNKNVQTFFSLYVLRADIKPHGFRAILSKDTSFTTLIDLSQAESLIKKFQ